MTELKPGMTNNIRLLEEQARNIAISHVLASHIDELETSKKTALDMLIKYQASLWDMTEENYKAFLTYD